MTQFIYVMDYSDNSIHRYKADVGHELSNEETEAILHQYGFNISQVSYMTTNKVPDIINHNGIITSIPKL